MEQEIKSKSELAALSTKLSQEAATVSSDLAKIKSVVGQASNYDGINISGAASKISTRLTTLASDIEQIASNIKNYVSEFDSFDVNDFDVNNLAEDIQIPSDIASINDDSLKNTTNNYSETSPSTNTGNTGVGSGLAGVGTGAAIGSAAQNSGGSNYSPSYNNGGSSSIPSGGGSSNNSSSRPSGGGSSNNSSSGRPSSGTSSSTTGDARDEITEKTVIEPSGKTTEDGRTQRSAKENIIIEPGDPNDPNIDVTKYNDNIAKGFEVTTGNLTYELCDEDVDLLCAIVSAESDKSYDDALAVVSTILNRCETSNWINSHGRDPIAQATAPNQYVVYQHGSYEGYMNGKAPDTVKQAVLDALAGVRNHNYCSFRSNGSTSYSDNMITATGNRYK